MQTSTPSSSLARPGFSARFRFAALKIIEHLVPTLGIRDLKGERRCVVAHKKGVAPFFKSVGNDALFALPAFHSYTVAHKIAHRINFGVVHFGHLAPRDMLGADVEGAVADVDSRRSNRDSAGPHDQPTRKNLDEGCGGDSPQKFGLESRLAAHSHHHDEGRHPGDANNPQKGLGNAKFSAVHAAKILAD